MNPACASPRWLSYPAIKLHFTPPSKYYYLMQIQHQILLFGLIRISGALSVNDVIGLRALLLLVLFSIEPRPVRA